MTLPDTDGTQEAAATNTSAHPRSGLLDKVAAHEQWTPATALCKIALALRPTAHTSSPVPFFHIIERLKTTKREGWRRFKIERGESIADHMYRMSIITMLAPPALSSTLDIARCTKMALVHDMAESLVGDITPIDGVSKSEKSRRESTTMDYMCQDLLGGVDGGAQGRELRAAWQEYEEGKTRESEFVHDVDKIELILQMMEYEKSQQGKIDLGEFTWVARNIKMREVKQWAQEILVERENYWKSIGKQPSGGQDASAARVAELEEYYGKNTDETS